MTEHLLLQQDTRRTAENERFKVCFDRDGYPMIFCRQRAGDEGIASTLAGEELSELLLAAAECGYQFGVDQTQEAVRTFLDTRPKP